MHLLKKHICGLDLESVNKVKLKYVSIKANEMRVNNLNVSSSIFLKCRFRNCIYKTVLYLIKYLKVFCCSLKSH